MLAPKSLHFYEKKKELLDSFFVVIFKLKSKLSFILTACVDIIVIELRFSGKIENIIHEGKKLY